MQDPSAIQSLFSSIDKTIMNAIPGNNPMLMRVFTSAIAVTCFGVEMFVSIPYVYWIGIISYIFCWLLYFEGLLRSLILMHKVSAELLIVAVMSVTLIDGEPLSGAMVAWFIGLGLYMSLRIIKKNNEKIESLIKEGKRTTRVIHGCKVTEVPVKEVCKDDMIIVPKGEIIPVDGIIMEGQSFIDESTITGEPFPVFKKEGNCVISGTINLSCPLSLQATKDGDESFVSVITNEIENSLKNKSGLQQRADRIVQILLLSVTVYSFLLYFIKGDLKYTATALSVVCPCAWALATPTAYAATIGSLARSGILARGGEPLEVIHDAKTLIFDKTGTVTLTEPEVTELIPINIRERELLAIAASLESRFNHPIASSILNYARSQGITDLKNVEQTEDLPGRGIKAKVDGKEVIIGSPDTIENIGISLPDIEYQGRAIWVAVDKKVKGVIVIRDVMHSQMRGMADHIRACGIEKVILATGDNEENEARRVAEIVGADGFYYNCKPADKAALVKEMQLNGKVIMVGDGVNDAPSLAASNLGIAIGGHKNVNLAIRSADIVILGEDARCVLDIFGSGRKLKRVLNLDYAWAFSFNIIGLSLATIGILTPIPAAMLHHVSSVFVVANASLIYFEKRRFI